MLPFGFVISEIMADFQARFTEVAEAAPVKQFGFKSAPKRFGMGIIVAVAVPAHALHDLVASY